MFTCKHNRVFRRDREPSRIPEATLKRLRRKGRKLKEFVYERIRPSIPKSSWLRRYVKVRRVTKNVCKLNAKRVRLNEVTQHEKYLLNCSVRVHQRIIKLKYRASRYLSMFSCSRPISQTHVSNYGEFQLRSDIEKNPVPTPMYIDPSKTITAPYSQANELVFGQNSGQQYVAVSLCSLIYNNKQGINSANDLVSIMNIGNQLYSSLSQLTRQSFLMQTELPTLLNVLETDYELQYSESYTGTIHQEATVEGYQYCTSLDRAFQSLISENFNNFVLKIGCTAVAIYCKGNVGLNIFDSCARDIYGRSHPQGTCVLLEVSSLNSLVHYFQSIHNDDIFELKGVNINKVQNSTLFQSHACETRKFNVSCAVAVYSLCYSVIKSCSYWNSNTLSDVIQYGKRLYENSSLNKYLPLDDLPKTVDVCGTEVSLDLKSDYSEGILINLTPNQFLKILKEIVVNAQGF